MAKAVQLAPNMNPEWWNDLGAVEMELARYNEAVQSFGSCVALKPEHAVCINNLSIAKRKAALTSSALKQFRDTQRAENSAEALFDLARKYKDEGLLSDEERTYKECLKRDGKYAPCHYGLFEIYSAARSASTPRLRARTSSSTARWRSSPRSRRRARSSSARGRTSVRPEPRIPPPSR